MAVEQPLTLSRVKRFQPRDEGSASETERDEGGPAEPDGARRGREGAEQKNITEWLLSPFNPNWASMGEDAPGARLNGRCLAVWAICNVP